jgi:hypothetical protein
MTGGLDELFINGSIKGIQFLLIENAIDHNLPAVVSSGTNGLNGLDISDMSAFLPRQRKKKKGV